MAILKSKDIAKMTISEINEKIKELRMEMIKAKVGAKKGGKSFREIRRTVAKLMTIKNLKTKEKTKQEQIKMKENNEKSKVKESKKEAKK